jgi:hypothetical protein
MEALRSFRMTFPSSFSWIRVLKGVSGVTDFVNCSRGEFGGCLWTGASIIPITRIARGVASGARGAVELGRVRRALASGESVWSLSNARRGELIEDALGFNMRARNFPVIDRWANGVATSIKSINLMAKTYRSGAKLRGRLVGMIDKLADFKGARWGGQRIRGGQIRKRRLLVAIPLTRLSPDQIVAMARAWRYGRSRRVRVRFTFMG